MGENTFDAALSQHRAGDLREAERLYHQVLARQPGHALALHQLGLLAQATGRLQEASEWLGRAAACNPEDAVCQKDLGNVLRDQQRLPGALEAYKAAVQRDPDCVEAHINIGVLLDSQGESEAAARAFREVLRVEPRHTLALFNLSSILLQEGDYAKAEEVCREALAIDPKLADVYQNLGVALTKLNRHEEAEHILRKVLDMDVDHANAHCQLGHILVVRKQYGEAMMEYRSVAESSYFYANAQKNLGVCLQSQGHAQAAIAAFARALDARPGYSTAHSNLVSSSNYLVDVSPSELYQRHLDWARRQATPLGGPALPGDDPARRLRVGYVSPNFRSHSVAYFIEPIIVGHDRNHFEVTCYSDVQDPDDYTRRLGDSADHWRDLRGLNDDEVAALIRKDDIDILVDLAGHTVGGRLLVFARRVAPIQVSYLGYPNTTGLEQMDYRLTDETADPVGEADEIHSEKLIRLASGFLCYSPLIEAPPVTDLPARSNGWITFGSFNNTCKVNESVVAVWARLLSALPGSRLVLKSLYLADDGARERLLELFAGHGIEGKRLDLMDALESQVEHLNAYAGIDIALDPFPYNGTTTTCEALWMGVPVIALAGDVHRARVGVSVLHHAGLAELVAPSIDAYLTKALSMARDTKALAALRRRLRPQLANSALTDAKATIRCLENAYREMWRQHCELPTD